MVLPRPFLYGIILTMDTCFIYTSVRFAATIFAVVLALSTSGAAKVETTMVVARCQAILKNGQQCSNQVASDQTYCWKHRGAAKAVRESLDDAGKGAGSAWRATKTWSTNAWQSTKSGTAKALKATGDAFEEAGTELARLIGGEKAAKKDDTKKGSSAK